MRSGVRAQGGKRRRRRERGVWLWLDSQLACIEGGGEEADDVLGVPIAMLRGKPLLGSLPFVDGEAIAEVLRGVLEGSAGAVVVAELRRAGVSRWLELAARPLAVNDFERGAARSGEGDSPGLLALAVQDVTARVGEEMRLRAALVEERAIADLAGDLARWSDAGLDEALDAGLERIARHFGAARGAIVATGTDDPASTQGDASVVRTPLVGLEPPRALELEWEPGRPAHPDPGRLLARQAELLASLLIRHDQAHRGRDLDQRFRVLADNSRDGVCEIDGAGRILYASPSFAAICGRASNTLEGLPFLELVELDDRRRVARFIRPGREVRRRDVLVYRLLRTPDEPRRVESTSRAYVNGQGDARVVVVTRDVSEREQTRLALERQIELEAHVADLSRQFVDVDFDETQEGIESQLAAVSRLADAQHGWFYSFSTGSTGPECFEWWLDRTPERVPVPMEESVATFPYSTSLIQSGVIYHVPHVDSLPREAESERRDLLARGVRSMLGIPIMSNGSFVGFLGFESYRREVSWSEESIMLFRLVGEIFYSGLRRRRVVRDLQESQLQLIQAQKMEAVGTLAGGIAHDFNNHLAVMLGNARFLRQEVAVRPDVRAAIEDLERSADHCAKLTRSLLAFARRSPLTPTRISVGEVVRAVEGLVRPLLPTACRLATDLAGSLGEIEVDPVQIQQVLVNLLVNARDAMPAGGEVRMGAERRVLTPEEAQPQRLTAGREYAVLTVADTGCGMDEKTRRRVFEPFFTTKPVGQGTGLGLAMAYGIVRDCRGAIEIESVVGSGTTVRVFLPCVDENAVSGNGDAPSGESPRRRVAVLEPDPSVRGMILELLAEKGVEVDVARSPEWIAESVRRASVSLDFVVAAMPRTAPSPDAFAEALRSGVTGPPILALAEAGHATSAALDPRVVVLRKPLARAELREAIDAWLASSEASSIEG